MQVVPGKCARSSDKSSFQSSRWPYSLGIDLAAALRRPVEKDEYQGIARFGHCIAALAGYLSGHATRILRNHLTEAIALDGNLLSGFDLIVEFDQVFNETARSG